MILSFKYRIYPTKKQILILDGHLEEACELYNCAISERVGAWKTCRKSITYYDQVGQIKAMREDGCLKLPNFSSAQNVIKRVDLAFAGFFRRVKNKQRPGFPRYKSPHRYNSITFPMYGNGCRVVSQQRLHIQGVGQVKLKMHRQLPETIKTATITRDSGRWHVVFYAEPDGAVSQDKRNDSVGIDVGIIHFLTMSTGESVNSDISNGHAVRSHQRKVSRRKRGSHRRRKAVAELRRAHAKVRNKRSDFHHKLSRRLVNEYGLIAVEDLNVAGLARGILAKQVNDAAWSQFLNFLSYKAEWAGRKLVKVDPRGTSQTCVCGESVPKTLRQRWHDCPKCGLSADRDHVSAQVILQRARNWPSGANVEAVSSCVSREAVAA